MLAVLGVHSRRLARPVPPRLAGLVGEAWWLALACAVGYLALSLGSYTHADPGWSHAGPAGTIGNLGGAIGAWIADVLLFAFGVSAWWWVGLGVAALWWSFPYRHGEREGVHLVNLAGFALLLAGSVALEALRLHSLAVELPYRPGGALGALVSGPLLAGMGFTGSSLALLLAVVAGFSLFSGMSWLLLMERVGEGVERTWSAAQWAWIAWRDRRAGAIAASRREEQLQAQKKRIEEQAPVRIEPQVTQIPKSERVERERQVPLFQDLPDSPLPPLRLLDEPAPGGEGLSPEVLEYTSRLIERKLMEFGVDVKVLAAYPGPVITRYEVEPAVGVKGSQVTNLVKDLARALSVVSIRVVETIPGKSCMGLEIPNPQRQVVRLSEILSSQVYGESGSPLTLVLGKDIAGKPMVADLARMPHLLVAGTTGSGKSVAINAMILSLLYKTDPSQVRLVLVDPKMLELSVYEGIPHLLCPVVTDMKQAANALHWCVGEMDRRYKLMSALGVRNLHGFNHKLEEARKRGEPLVDPLNPDPQAGPLEPLPYVVVVIDELADLMMVVGKKVEELIARLAQKARAAGVHLVLATQRPSVDVITGLIKANIPTRIAFQVSSRVDARTILDQGGAEALLGQGDMLYLPPGTGHPQRVHGAYVADHEVHHVVEYLRAQGQPDFVAGVLEGPEETEEAAAGADAGDAENDPLYDQAVAIVLKSRRASISLVQRHLRIGYNRAARLIEAMEKAGLVSAMQSNGNREVLAPALAE